MKEAKRLASRHYDGWDWTRDGQFSEPRVKRKHKKRRTRMQRAIERRLVRKKIEEENKERGYQP